MKWLLCCFVLFLSRSHCTGNSETLRVEVLEYMANHPQVIQVHSTVLCVWHTVQCLSGWPSAGRPNYVLRCMLWPTVLPKQIVLPASCVSCNQHGRAHAVLLLSKPQHVTVEWVVVVRLLLIVAVCCSLSFQALWHKALPELTYCC
jgi:hypothetical protein